MKVELPAAESKSEIDGMTRFFTIITMILTLASLTSCGRQTRQEKKASAAAADLVCAGDGLKQKTADQSNADGSTAPKKVLPDNDVPTRPLTGPTSAIHMQSREKMALRIHYMAKDDAAKKIDEAKKILDQYPSGKTALGELNGNNPKNAPIEIKLATSGEIKRLTGFDGGTIVPRKQGNTYIIASSDANSQELAQLIAHESQHVIDDYDYLRVADLDPTFDAGRKQASLKLREGTVDSLSDAEKNVIKIVAADDLCLEARAYSRNLALDKEGLPVQIPALKTDSLASYISKAHIEQAGLTLPASADELVALCLQQKSIVDFHAAVTAKYK